MIQAELYGMLRLKVKLVWQYYESHVACSVDQTPLPLCLFKLNTEYPLYVLTH